MNEKKCKTCAFYDSFFNSCNLYFDEVYFGEGDFNIIPVNIKKINKSECNYIAKDDKYVRKEKLF